MGKKVKLLFGIAFGIPLIIWIVLLGSFIKSTVIVRTGKPATADVIAYGSNLTRNDVKMYYVDYTFLDDNGIEHSGRSSSKYTYNQVQSMTTIEIKYDKNFNSIEADFKYDEQFELFILPIFGMISIGFLISLIVEIVNDKRDKYLLQYGFDGEARFVDSKSNVTINGVPYHRVWIEYNDNNNQYHQAKLKKMLRVEQVNFLRGLKTFKIKYKNNSVVLNEKFDYSSLKKTDDKKIDHAQPLEEKKCEYCGSVYDVSEKKCPNCGSRIYEVVKHND